MSRATPTEARRAGWMILALFVMPVASVSAAALLADVASTTDPTAALVGLPATLGGLLTGAVVFRLARLARSGAIAVRALLLAGRRRFERLAAPLTQSVVGAVVALPAPALVPARVGRRGPPVASR